MISRSDSRVHQYLTEKSMNLNEKQNSAKVTQGEQTAPPHKMTSRLQGAKISGILRNSCTQS